MSDSIRNKAAALAAGLSCLAVAYALAQPAQPGQPVRPPTPPGGAGVGQQQQGAIGLGQQQAVPPGAIGLGQPAQPIARGENRQVDQFFAGCLLAKNQAEIELSKLALERAQNPQVKQFAQQMIAEHQAQVQKLEPIAPRQSASAYGGASGTTERTREIQQTNFDTPANTSGQVMQQSGQVGQPGQPVQPGQTATLQQRPGTTGQTIQQPGLPPGTQTSSEFQHQVASIEREIGDRVLAAVKQKLEEKRGAEFDQCYIGGQIFCHLEMAAALEVLKTQTSGELREIVQDAQPKVKQHLAMAEQIGEQLMNASTTRQADRPTTETVPRVPR